MVVVSEEGALGSWKLNVGEDLLLLYNLLYLLPSLVKSLLFTLSHLTLKTSPRNRGDHNLHFIGDKN